MKTDEVPNLVNIVILTLVTIVCWILFSVIRLISSPPPDVDVADVLQPFDPTLNVSALGSLNQRIQLTDEQIPQALVTPETPAPEPTEEPEESPTPESTATAEPTPTEEPVEEQ